MRFHSRKAKKCEKSTLSNGHIFGNIDVYDVRALFKGSIRYVRHPDSVDIRGDIKIGHGVVNTRDDDSEGLAVIALFVTEIFEILIPSASTRRTPRKSAATG